MIDFVIGRIIIVNLAASSYHRGGPFINTVLFIMFSTLIIFHECT